MLDEHLLREVVRALIQAAVLDAGVLRARKIDRDLLGADIRESGGLELLVHLLERHVNDLVLVHHRAIEQAEVLDNDVDGDEPVVRGGEQIVEEVGILYLLGVLFVVILVGSPADELRELFLVVNAPAVVKADADTEIRVLVNAAVYRAQLERRVVLARCHAAADVLPRAAGAEGEYRAHCEQHRNKLFHLSSLLSDIFFTVSTSPLTVNSTFSPAKSIA